MSEPAARPRPAMDFDEFERRLRNPESAANAPASDPLAELARLVDGGRDPYADVFSRSNRRPGLRAVEPPDMAWPPSAAAPAPEVSSPNDHDAWAVSAGEWPTEDSGDEAAHAAPAHQDFAHGDDLQDDQQDMDWDDVPTEHRSHRVLFIVLGLFAIVGVGVGATLMTRGGTTVQDAPVIKADGGPMKVQPEAPVDSAATAKAPSVLDKSPDRLGATRVVNNVEQPIDVNSARGAQPIVPPPVPAPAPAANVFPEPRRVRTIPVRPDGSLLSDAAPAAEPAKPPTVVVSPFPRPASLGNGNTPAVARTVSPVATPAAPTPPKATTRVVPPTDVTASTPSRPVPPKPVQLAGADLHETPARSAATGGFAVQLAAAGSDTEARDRANRYASQYGSALGGHKPSVVRGDVNGKSVYRVRVVGLSREDANSMCQQIKDAGGACFISGN